MVSDPDLLLGIGIGLSMSAIAYLIGRFYVRAMRRGVRTEPERSPAPDGQRVAEHSEPVVPVANSLGETSRYTPGPAPLAKRLTEPDPRGGPEPPEPGRNRVDVETELRTSQRILLHLALHGRSGSEGSFPEALCQKGIGRALGLGQGAVSGVLRRLEWGGAISSQTAHVQGHDRRLKVYLLTDRGVNIVRGLYRDHRRGSARPVTSGLAVIVEPSEDPHPARPRGRPDASVRSGGERAAARD